MKAYCPSCGQWTDDDWTEGPFGPVCWPCRYALAEIGRALVADSLAFDQVGRILKHGYGRVEGEHAERTSTPGSGPGSMAESGGVVH